MSLVGRETKYLALPGTEGDVGLEFETWDILRKNR